MDQIEELDDRQVLLSINQARDRLRRHCNDFDDGYSLPACAATPYYRSAVTTVAERHKKNLENDSLSLKEHSSISCDVLGALACSSCQMNRRRSAASSNRHLARTKFPIMTSRHLGGMKHLAEMAAYGSFEPVIPSYHYMDHEDKLEYYCPWTQSMRTEIKLPIITHYELLQRVSRKRKVIKPVNPKDNLPSMGTCSRPSSAIQSQAVPANSQIQTPNPPDDRLAAQPPIIDTWREWNLHHVHL